MVTLLILYFLNPYTKLLLHTKEMYKAQRIIYLYDIKRVEALGSNEGISLSFLMSL